MPLGHGQHFGHARNRTDIDVVPTLGEVLVGEVDAQGLAEGGEVAGCRNLTSLVLLVGAVDGEPICNGAGITTDPRCPQSKGTIEVEVYDHTAEIEEQSPHGPVVVRELFVHPTRFAHRSLRSVPARRARFLTLPSQGATGPAVSVRTTSAAVANRRRPRAQVP